MHEILSPEWEAEVRERYKGPDIGGHDFNKTFPKRNKEIAEHVQKYINLGPVDQNLLFVGIGGYTPSLNDFSFAPGVQEIARMLEEEGKSQYRMTVLDIQKSNLNIFAESIEGDLNMPFSLIDKRKKGDLNLLEGDLMKVDLKPYGPFDLAHCINILCHIDGKGYSHEEMFNFEVLMLYNVTRNMKPRGIIIVDNSERDDFYWDTYTKGLIQRTDIGKKCGLVVEDEVRKDSKYSYLFVRKL